MPRKEDIESGSSTLHSSTVCSLSMQAILLKRAVHNKYYAVEFITHTAYRTLHTVHIHTDDARLLLIKN